MAILANASAGIASDVRAAGDIASAPDLPKVLNDADIRLYQRIFEVQETGDWKNADGLIKRLSNDVLMGHVLYQRYMHRTRYRSKYKELKEWTESYADHPGAGIIYKLALRRRPANWRMPKAPETVQPSAIMQARPSFKRVHIPGKRRSAAENRKARQIRYNIKQALRRGHTLVAKRIISEKATKRYLSDAEYDEARTGLAKGYFIAGRDDWALQWALPALERSGKYLPEGHWTAGLLLWRSENYLDAARHFEKGCAEPGCI